MNLRAGLVRRGVERRVYMSAAFVAVALMFAGFARTFYLKLAFGTPALPVLLHVHGWVMTSWFALFAAQVSLIASGNVKLHRRLGVFGACLAVAVVVLGSAVAIHAARAGRSPPGIAPGSFLIIPLADMLVFAVLVGSALCLRRRPDAHKRLMLLATLSLLTAAITRIPLAWLDHRLITDFSLLIALVLACVAWDTWHNRRLHPAFMAGALLIIISWPLRLALSHTPAWMGAADWLIR